MKIKFIKSKTVFRILNFKNIPDKLWEKRLIGKKKNPFIKLREEKP